MKFQVTLKTPDTIDTDITKAVNDSQSDNDYNSEIYEEEMENAWRLCSRWFRHGELLTVEIDTDKETCVVVQN